MLYLPPNCADLSGLIPVHSMRVIAAVRPLPDSHPILNDITENGPGLATLDPELGRFG